MNPQVAIITPIYNAEAFLAETLDSILASSYPHIEVILMDDGSNDDSLAIAQTYAAKDARVKAYTQPNAGASAARNHAIQLCNSPYILPIDADDLIHPDYVRQAVEILIQNPAIKVVSSEIEMFGDRTGRCHYPPFSLRLLARKNMIPICSMYRKSDWEKAGGYSPIVKGREDWDFWLSIFQHGGEFYRLPIVGVNYRIHAGSKRKRTQHLKRQLVDTINVRHRDFLYQQLGGPLHYHRTYSRFLNFFRTERQIGTTAPLEVTFAQADKVLHSGRNTIKEAQGIVIKAFAKPTWWRSIIYGLFRKSKARRSYEYALQLQDLTPTPIAYKEVRSFGMLQESYYACQKSACDYTFNDLISNPSFPKRERILHQIGSFTAQLHERGILHTDYSGGNILFNADGSKIEIVDLNRIHFKRQIDLHTGCRNFERLNIDKEALRIMAISYAKTRDFDQETCVENIIRMRWHKHIKQGITNL